MTLVQLNTGAPMPTIGFGVFQIAPEEVAGPVGHALEAGYRLIDTAAGYGNEPGVGRALAESNIARADLFITTKLANADHGYDQALRAFDLSLSKLGLDFVDLYLIHWPVPARDLYVETWRALEAISRDGRARSIGVSNFTAEHLKRVIDSGEIVPAVNQVELHPSFTQDDLRAFHVQHGIVSEAWAPIGQGKGLLARPEIGSLASKYGRTPAQVVLRWHLQLGLIAIPRSTNPDRIRANIDIFDFELDPDDLEQLTQLGPQERIGRHPDEFNHY